MIRRFYIMPLNAGVSDAVLQEFVQGFDDTDRFLPGLFDSSCGVDVENRTVVWENNFVDEATYSGPYMFHPYHAATLDTYLMGDSPLCITHDTFTVRYQTPDETRRLEKGVRRLLLMNIAEGSDTSAFEALVAKPPGMAISVFRADDVGWVSAKGRSWTHIWEQGFADEGFLERYLNSREGFWTSSKDGLNRLGLEVSGLKILTFPFALKPAPKPAPMPEPYPTFYTLTVRTDLEDVDAYIGLLKNYYDAYITEAGGKLVHRWRTVEEGYNFAEVQSTWEIKSVAAYHDLRMKTGNENWKRYVRDAMPLVKSGARRFYRAV